MSVDRFFAAAGRSVGRLPAPEKARAPARAKLVRPRGPTTTGMRSRWCVGYKVETAESVFRVRAAEPMPRTGGGAPPEAVTGARGSPLGP